MRIGQHMVLRDAHDHAAEIAAIAGKVNALRLALGSGLTGHGTAAAYVDEIHARMLAACVAAEALATNLRRL